MYSPLKLAFKYLRYYLTASNGRGHGIHSPFVFNFITKVLNDKQHYAEYGTVEKLRQQLIHNQTLLTVEDLGAGSSLDKTNRRTVSSIAKNAVKSKKYGQLLFRMVKAYQPDIILELGTSLGITTSYLSLGRPDAKLITMEGAREVAAIAKRNVESLGLQNVSIAEGNFDKTLLAVVYELSSVDFAFIDGNHRKEPTEKYFQLLLSKTHAGTILVFDDIHWSREMESAWQTIRQHKQVGCTIDLFFIGIVFFSPEFREKQHFRIRF